MKYKSTEVNTRTRLDKAIGTGTQRPRRRLRHRAQAQANAQAERPAATRDAQPSCAKNANAFKIASRRTYNKHLTIYNRWLENGLAGYESGQQGASTRYGGRAATYSEYEC